MRVLFLGEGSADGPARYLEAVLSHAHMEFHRVRDQEPIPAEFFKRKYDAIIFSDYRYSNLTVASEGWIVQQVDEGAGLLMIGGWASFTGLLGHYKGSHIEALLPVTCLHEDDRVNRACGAVLLPRKGPTALEGISFEIPPVVCGYHRVDVKSDAEVLMDFHDLNFPGGKPSLGAAHPALAVRELARSRSAAFLTDCAPHWAGGLLDWGPHRVQVPIGKSPVEVGNSYVAFFTQLIRHIGRPDGVASDSAEHRKDASHANRH